MATSTWPKGAWTPRRRHGGIYCSPACGARCTLRAFEQATKRAERLAAAAGPGWKPRVWENMGWFYSAVKGKAELYEQDDGYSLTYNNDVHNIVVAGLTPTGCIQEVIATLSRAAVHLQNCIDAIR